MPTTLLQSYADLPLQHIRVSHVPPEEKAPTKVILITLYRPGKHNAFTGLMMHELETVYGMLNLDPRVKAIVVTGEGNIFCAGADLDGGKGLSFKEDTVRTHRDGGGRVALAIHRCTKPTVAAINGSAVGVGITMCLPMSIRVVSEKAKIGFVFARRGIVMEAASSFFLPRLVGYGRAVHLVTTGAVYPSTSPLLTSLFSEILPPAEVLPRALAIADDIATNTSSVSTAVMKDMIWRNPGTAEQTHLLDSKILVELFEGKDKKEGIDSFMEKREPAFKGNMEENAPTAWPWWEDVDLRVPETIEDVKAKL